METEHRSKKRPCGDEKSGSDHPSEEDDYVPYVPVKIRKHQMQLKMLRLRGKVVEEEQKDSGGEQRDEDEGLGPRSNVSLLDQHQVLKEKAEARKESAKEKQLKEEQKILQSVAEGRALMSVKEMAKGIIYDDPIKTSWLAPRYILNMPPARHDRVRKKYHILVDGDGIPPPIKSFREMKFPQGESEEKIGPKQTHTTHRVLLRLSVKTSFEWSNSKYSEPVSQPTSQSASQVSQANHMRSVLCIGGMSVKDQMEVVKQQGQRQTLLFSATMPKKIQNFAKSALVKPITINVGRAGAASLDVIQEVEYVKEEAKMVYLLECLQKTPPPVLMFAEKKADVDAIHEYLLLKGVEAVAIHGGKDQEERTKAIEAFKEGKKDVLVATDVASKGLDFPAIQHVVNYDMPEEIENYVHRIGRTGRSGKTGIATTFINKGCDESVLMDLKALLIEAKQKVPPVLQVLQTGDETMLDIGGERGCTFCGGLGHRITDCPKLEAMQTKQVTNIGRKDYLAHSSMDF
nr:LOW QUALITY PROTEIN: probable ATP-dependent RNA helicase DDX41 [Salvelinus alpinus]